MRNVIVLLALAAACACGEQPPAEPALPPAIQTCVDAFTQRPGEEMDPIALEERAARAEDACTCFSETASAEDLAFITPVFAIEQQGLAPAERTRRVVAYLAEKGAGAEARLNTVRGELNSQCPFREAYPPEDGQASGVILDAGEPESAPPAP